MDRNEKVSRIDIDGLSLRTYNLDFYFEETKTKLASATGFFYEYENIYYLITNGHNLTVVNPESNTRIADHASIPTLIRARAKTKVNSVEGAIGLQEFVVDIYEDGDVTKPLWYVHKTHGYKVDVVAIPVVEKEKVPNHIPIFAFNEYNFDSFKPEVADDVFVLGYPFNLKVGIEFPIWKKGSIATEPRVEIDGLPKILIDTATKKGMSGSPVIFQRIGLHNQNGKVGPDSIIGRIRGFLGIYSGRIGAGNEFDAQLGIVWKKEVIDEILKEKVIGSVEFQNALMPNL